MKDMNRKLTDQDIARLLRGMDEFVTVPEDATRGWKRAVKREMRVKKRRSALRWACEIAAALLLVVGLTAFLRAQEAPSALSAQDVPVKYMYLSDSEEVVLFAMDSSADDTVLLTGAAFDVDAGTVTEEAEPAETEALKAKKALEQEEAEASAELRYAQAAIGARDADKAAGELRQLLRSYDASIAEESSRVDNGIKSVSGVIRVKQDELSELCEALKRSFSDLELIVRTADPVQMNRDAQERTEAAYAAIERLSELLKDADADNTQALHAQINALFDEIDAYRADAKAGFADEGYTAVFYTITAQSRSVFALGFTGGAGPFMRDMVKVLIMLLPAVALTALISAHIFGRRRAKTA